MYTALTEPREFEFIWNKIAKTLSSPNCEYVTDVPLNWKKLARITFKYTAHLNDTSWQYFDGGVLKRPSTKVSNQLQGGAKETSHERNSQNQVFLMAMMAKLKFLFDALLL